MRLSPWIPAIASLLAAATALAKTAPNCNINMSGGSAPYSERNKAKKEWEDKINALHAKNPRGASLYFVFADGKKPEIEAMPIPHEEDSDRAAVPTELAKRLSRSGPVKVYNRTARREGTVPVGTYSSIYFMPYALGEFKNIHPKTDFDAATNIGGGCNTIDLKGVETISLAYGNVAKYADNIVAFNRNPSAGTAERIAGEVTSLKKKGIGTGSGRSPASTAAPTYAEEKVDRQRKVKKLPAEPIKTRDAAKTLRSGDGG